MPIVEQIYGYVILSIVVACITWTVTQEEIFSEWRSYCKENCQTCRTIPRRKFFYIFTCEYCFSHWTTVVTLILTGFKLLYNDWRGYVIAFFAIPWLANQLMSIYRRLRVGIKHENLQAKEVEERLEEQ